MLSRDAISSARTVNVNRDSVRRPNADVIAITFQSLSRLPHLTPDGSTVDRGYVFGALSNGCPTPADEVLRFR